MSETKTVKHKMTMAAPAAGELDAMYNFFNLLEMLYNSKWGNIDTAEELEDSELPEDWIKIAHKCWFDHDGGDSWKGELIAEIFKYYSINCGWRRVIGGFDSLFNTFCVKDSSTLTYDTDHLTKLVEEGEDCKIIKVPNHPTIDLPDE